MTAISAPDIAIIGGGIMGLSTAHFLKTLSPSLDVTVIETDPSYEFCSTLRASGGARRLFSCVENIAMSNFSIPFIKSFAETMAVVRDGCEVLLLSPAELKARFPSMYVGDLGGGVLSPRDGWCDPNSLLQGFKRKCASIGVTFIHDRVVGLHTRGATLTHARLASGAEVCAQAFVNAAGAWAGEVSALASVPLPVAPLKRYEHYFTCGNPIERLPYVKDLSRLAFRSEGVGFSGGLVDGSATRGFDFDIDHNYFENVVWPAVAHRFPPFESAKCHRTWAGLYEQCELDGNPIIGATSIENFYAIAGFSGHGMMHAPAAGRGIAELIVHGEFKTIDLTRLGYARVMRGEPYREAGIL
jgi:FAD-dependent oxidoreductase domain-containing protein 1